MQVLFLMVLDLPGFHTVIESTTSAGSSTLGFNSDVNSKRLAHELTELLVTVRSTGSEIE